jgi:hypothetical protein
MSRAAHTNRHVGWAWLLVALVLLLRAAVPQGFMPERTESGGMTLAACGSGGLVHIPIERDAPAQKRTPSHCAFAGIGAADLPPPLVLPARNWMPAEFAERAEAAQSTARLYPRPPSRGPPAFA